MARRALALARKTSTRSQRNPLPHVRLTTPQTDFASLLPRRALWRGANQIGKTYGLSFDIVHTARGTHPLRPVHRPPVRLLVIGESWTQMDPLCAKLWDMLPKDEIDERVRYEPGGGFAGFKNPRIPFVSGPGAGSVIIFATYEQGAKRIAGGSYHGAYLDEPPPERVYGEVMPRLSRFNGTLRISMTPTPESPPLEYLRKKVKEGTIAELHTSLTMDAITVRGGLLEKPWKTPEEIEDLIAGYLEVERGMRVEGDWDPVLAGRWFTAFGDGCVTNEGPGELVWTAIGIDHGAKAGRQAAQLVCCSDDGERVWYLDEARSDGRTSTEDDARAILAMIERHPWIGGWSEIDYWVGDRAHGGDYWGNAKSNSDLMMAFSKIIGRPRRHLHAEGLKLFTPNKRRGSITRGVRLMNSLFKENQATVNLRCQGLIEGMKRWEGRPDDHHKDPIDAARYATELLFDRAVLRPRREVAARIY